MFEKKEESSDEDDYSEEEPISKDDMFTYNNCFIRTRMESDVVKYNWEIDNFNVFYEYSHSASLTSPAFPERPEYRIKIEFHKEKNAINFIIITEKSFLCSCLIHLKDAGFEKGHLIDLAAVQVKGNTLLCEHKLTRISDKCTISFTLRIFREIVSNSVHTPFFRTNLEKNSKLDNSELVTFILNDTDDISISKDKLCATNSNYFNTLCRTLKEIPSSKVDIEENADSFKAMLTYIETGLLNQNVNYEKLLEIAQKYDVQQLKVICEQYLIDTLTVETAVEHIKLAWLHDAEYLANYAIDIIKLYHDTILQSTEFEALPNEYFERIIKCINKSKIFEHRERFESNVHHF